MSKLFGRREFIIDAATLAATAAAAASCLPDVDGSWSTEGAALCSEAPPLVVAGPDAQAGRVIEAHDPSLLDGLKIAEAAVLPVLQRLLLRLTGAVDIASAWKQLLPTFAPGQVIGVKVNVLSDRVPTHPEVVRALVDSLKDGLGARAEQIVVWDRRLDELIDARLTPERLGGVLVEGTWEDRTGPGALGRGYEAAPICIAGRRTHLSTIATRRIDHLINFAVMKNHNASGFTGCLKNHYGTIDNPGDFHDRTSSGVVVERRFERAIPEINALREVADKARLWLVDATIGVCKMDTSDPPDCWPARLLASLDPVAIDVRARQIRDQERGDRLGPSDEKISAGWLDEAERLGLGSQRLALETV